MVRHPSEALSKALAALDEEELRHIVGEIEPWLDDRAHARLLDRVIELAARKGAAWVHDPPSADDADSMTSFARAMSQAGHADAGIYDEALADGERAFLARMYPAAATMLDALLTPLAGGEVYLGEDELVDEVLATSLPRCTARYVVAVYMTSEPDARPEAVLDAIETVSAMGAWFEPLRTMERAALEPLPDLHDFLPGWRALLEARVGEDGDGDWFGEEDRWLREVVLRLEGPAGLESVARRTRRRADLGAWCTALIEAGDWQGALLAYEQAAELLSPDERGRADLLDGAALAAQELGRDELHAHLERAWRLEPTTTRLRRWLGAAESPEELRCRAADALEACPAEAGRQRALLRAVRGELAEAAELLACAPPLGWSSPDHPGHLVFPLFATLLGARAMSDAPPRDLDELAPLYTPDGPRLSTPPPSELVERAGVTPPRDAAARARVLDAMRAAAEARAGAVTGNQRRRHYRHAAWLVAACESVDPTGEGSEWLERVRKRTRRYPAFRRELADCGV